MISAYLAKRRSDSAFAAAAFVALLTIVFSSVAVLHLERDYPDANALGADNGTKRSYSDLERIEIVGTIFFAQPRLRSLQLSISDVSRLVCANPGHNVIVVHWIPSGSAVSQLVATDSRFCSSMSSQFYRRHCSGRKNYYGSGAEWSGRLAVMLFSIFATLALCKINPRKWLSWYFEACAASGGKPPDNPASFLPWNLSETRLADLQDSASNKTPPDTS